MRLYLDACIWRDYWENRSDRFRPLGEWAHRLIMDFVANGGIIYYSSAVLKELHKYYDEIEVQEILSIVPKKQLVELKLDPRMLSEAKTLSQTRNLPFGDAIHALLAGKNHAILISRDRHFRLLTDIVEVRLPEDLI